MCVYSETLTIPNYSSTPLQLFLFAATLTPVPPPVRRFPPSFSASRPIHRRPSNFAALCRRSSPVGT
ncbi:hypothetical protein S83_026715 [Arachis hypogaea]